MNVLPFDRGRKYYPSTCPICEGAALEADLAHRQAEFQCAFCCAYEITPAARSAMRGLSQEHRALWLSQADNKPEPRDNLRS